MSVVSSIIGSLHDVPASIVSGLNELRATDGRSHDIQLELAAAESAILNDLKNAIDNGETVDTVAFTARYNELVERRNNLLLTLEGQNKLAQSIYGDLDKRISNLDVITKHIAYLFPHNDDTDIMPGADANRNRNKKKNQNSIDTIEIPTAVDPNEPLYCYCRRVSYGQMVACENSECTVEWFHFQCVGLTADPTEPWFCVTCRKALGMEVETDDLPMDVANE